MFERIKAELLKHKGTNSVSSRTLDEQATLLSSLITTDEQLTGYDFKKHIDVIGGNISHDTAEQVRIEKERLKGEYSKDVKTTEQLAAEKAAEDLRKGGEQKGVSPEIQALIDGQKKMMETIGLMQGEKIATDRTGQLNSILKDVPTQFKEQVTSSFERMKFENDDDFEAFKTQTKSNVDGLVQMAKEQNLSFHTPPANVQKPVDDGQTSELARAREMVAKQKKD